MSVVKGAIFFPEHVRVARAILQPDELGQLFLAVCDYSEHEGLPSGEYSAAWNACFGIMKDAIDRNNARYAEICERNRKNAKKRSSSVVSGGERPQATTTERIPSPATASDGQRPQAMAANITKRNLAVTETEPKQKQKLRACAREAAAPPASPATIDRQRNLVIAKALARRHGLTDDDLMLSALLEDFERYGVHTVDDAFSRAAMSGPVTIERYRSLLPAVR